MYLSIDSNKNPVVKKLKELSSAKSRKEHGTFLLEGPKLLTEALESGFELKTVLAESRFADTESALLSSLERSGANIYIASRAAIEAASDTKTPQGVVAEAVTPTITIFPNNGLIVALDGVQDPGNMGTVLRSADAFGAAAVMLSDKCADAWSPKCVRSAMGSSFHIPVIREAAFVEKLTELRNDGFCIVAGHLKGSGTLPMQIGKKAVLLIGSEGQGLSAEASGTADYLFRLEMQGRAESLNAAVFAGILLYEMSKRVY